MQYSPNHTLNSQELLKYIVSDIVNYYFQMFEQVVHLRTPHNRGIHGSIQYCPVRVLYLLTENYKSQITVI